MLLAARLHVERASRSAWTRHLPALTGLGFLCKVAYELRTGAALFAGGADPFVPVPLVHLAGGAIGLLAALWPKRSGLDGLARLRLRPTSMSPRGIGFAGGASQRGWDAAGTSGPDR